MFPIDKGKDRIIILEYLPLAPLRKVLQSQLHTLELRTRTFTEELVSAIGSGICETKNPLHLELYGKHWDIDEKA